MFSELTLYNYIRQITGHANKRQFPIERKSISWMINRQACGQGSPLL